MSAECLGSLCPPLIAAELAPHVPRIFFICVQMVHCVLSSYDTAEQEQAQDEVARAQMALLAGDEVEGHDLPPRDAAVNAIELLSAVFEALGPRVREVLYLPTMTGATEGSAPDPALAGKFHLLMAMTVRCLGSSHPTLRQTAFSLLGETMKIVPWVFTEPSPAYPTGGLLPPMMQSLEQSLTDVASADSKEEVFDLLAPLENTLWALGQVASAAHQLQHQGQPALLAALETQTRRLLNPLENVARRLDKAYLAEHGAIAQVRGWS